MLTSHRISCLQQIERQLRRLVRGEPILKDARNGSHGVSVADSNFKRTHIALKNKLLFRRVPITLSLLERSLLPIIRMESSSSRKVTGSNNAHPPKELEVNEEVTVSASSATLVGYETTQKSHLVPQQSMSAVAKISLEGRQRHNKRSILTHSEAMFRLFSSLHYLESERRKLYLHHTDRLKLKLTEAEAAVRAAGGRQGKTGPSRREAISAVRAVNEDISILKDSLLARSYLSARLWRFLLRKELWTAAIEDSRISERKEIPTVLILLLSLQRMSFGILQDVTQGRHLNACSPRFVVSLPSRSRRCNQEEIHSAEHETGDEGATSQSVHEERCGTSEAPEDDSMITLMCGTLPLTASESVQAKKRREISAGSTGMKKTSRNFVSSCRPYPRKLRWLPPRSCDALSLVVDSLALCSAVLTELNVKNIIIQWGQVVELFEVLTVVQSTASLLLAVGGTGNEEEVTKIHSVLRNLEDAMIAVGGSARQTILMEENEVLSSLSSVCAIRLLLALDGLQLLPMCECSSQRLIMQLLSRIFPQLSTGTQSALLQKSRQTSLFAFATRGHRLKLFSSYGNKSAVTAALESIRSRARLQQRQMQAALRSKYLEEVNTQSISELARNVSVHSLVAALSLFARTVQDARRQVYETQGRLLTASLFLIESILTAVTFSSPRGGDGIIHHKDLAPLLLALTPLWSLAHERCKLLRDVSNVRHNKCLPGKGAGSPLAKSEVVMVRYATDVVFNAVNVALVQRVELVENDSPPHNAVDGMEVISPSNVAAIVTALGSWCDISPNGKGISFVATTAALLKRLLLSDVKMWQELRLLSDPRREAFARALTEVMGSVGAMDSSVTEVLASIG
ncbi:hypothetical protein, conserved [Trypanosoma brucei gambiense DAL972]|uniref:Uncharacterized protein n=1 Tax=Trypanosoma brucei gambiense (strain MHOM/CI/86/DAL972) TaxID=679716 RepID=D0A455_TRYB9|nr:hypothetical protein, conserved [Trypanosoma brucei gambiense DAL972]CBH16049.1 hypothetical protein, conserved [Trypanosoma brucei gambiense DAL972]|eukprot:XP_011778313.1 hypothetical protein, conserved [Trypanosoma brucei gambiense DAL972]